MELAKAKAICAELAELKKRWGRHAGSGHYSEAQVREALMACYDAGLFDVDDKHTDVVLANRQKGAAEARATKYKSQLDDANKRIEELVIALEKAEKSSKSESKKGFFS